MTRERALLIGIVLELVAVGVSAVAYPSLPHRVPTHWDVNGNATAYSSPIVAAIVTPAIIGMLWAFMLVLPAISPRGFRLEQSAGVFYTAMLAVIAFSLAMHVMLIRAALTDGRASIALLFAALGALLAVIGALLRKVKRNFWFGVRTPWTLASDEVWSRTNKLAGHLFVIGGSLIIIASFVPALRLISLMAILAAIAIASIVYSYVMYRRIEGFGPES